MRGRTPRRLRIGARYVEEAAAVELSVGDTGHGISEDNIRRVFDPFFTTRDVGEGTGLGLSICYGILRDHGGQIRVESRVGVGTTFSFLLPARLDAPAPGAPRKCSWPTASRASATTSRPCWPAGDTACRSPTAATPPRSCGPAASMPRSSIRAEWRADLTAWRSARSTDAERTAIVLMTSTEDDERSRAWGRRRGPS